MESSRQILAEFQFFHLSLKENDKNSNREIPSWQIHWYCVVNEPKSGFFNTHENNYWERAKITDVYKTLGKFSLKEPQSTITWHKAMDVVDISLRSKTSLWASDQHLLHMTEMAFLDALLHFFKY